MTRRADVSTSLPPPVPTSHTSNSIPSISRSLHEAQLCQSATFHRCLLCDSTLLLKTSLRCLRNKQKESKHSQQLPLPSGSTHSAHVVLWAIFSPSREQHSERSQSSLLFSSPRMRLRSHRSIALVLNTCKLFLCCSAEQPRSSYSIEDDSFLICSNVLKYEGDLRLYFVHAHYPVINQSTNIKANTQSPFRKHSKLCEHKRSTNRNRTRKRKERKSTANPCTPQLSAKTESSLYRAWDLLLYCTKGVKSPHSGTAHLLKLAVKSVDSCKSVVPSANRKPVFIFLAQEYGEFHVQIKHLQAKEKNPAKGVTLK